MSLEHFESSQYLPLHFGYMIMFIIVQTEQVHARVGRSFGYRKMVNNFVELCHFEILTVYDSDLFLL